MNGILRPRRDISKTPTRNILFSERQWLEAEMGETGISIKTNSVSFSPQANYAD
jgi:hypothetical protein